MTCYFRHIGSVFDEDGVAVKADNKKELDRLIHASVDVPYED